MPKVDAKGKTILGLDVVEEMEEVGRKGVIYAARCTNEACLSACDWRRNELKPGKRSLRQVSTDSVNGS